MDVQSLRQIIGSGNFKAAEEAWFEALADEQTTPAQFRDAAAVLEELAKQDNQPLAEELAWAAVETLRERFEPAQTLVAARAMLLAVPGSEEVRNTVVQLYRLAHESRPNIDRLIEEAGLAGSRTPRRAMRTLDQCLAARPGTCLVGRHDDDRGARVQRIDPETWQFTIETREGAMAVDPTRLADTYVPVEDDDYRVLQYFDPDRLAALLEEQPAQIVRSIVKGHRGRMDSDTLEVFLTPRFLPIDRWTKWWQRARTQLKRLPDIRIEGRSPYVIVYDPDADTPEEQTQAALDGARDPARVRKIIDDYLRECKARKVEPDTGLLESTACTLEARAAKQRARGNKIALTTLLVAARVRQVLGHDGADHQAVAFLAEHPDPVDAIRNLELADLWIPACEALARARPESLADLLSRLLLVAPTAACDTIACRLVAAGFPAEDLEELVQEIMAEPMERLQALLWLWHGPSEKAIADLVASQRVLHRILSMMAELKRTDRIEKTQIRKMCAAVRSALSAKKYVRFEGCLDTMDERMGAAIYTQIRRLDELGRAAKEDLLRRVSSRFPDLHARPKIEPWADESVLYVTARGLAAKEAEVHELVNVKMRENAKAIGAAAERGDLSENSEYKFALEERDLLRARLAQMNEQLAIARILEAGDVPADHAGIGSLVTLRHAESGDELTLILLGPWEADASKGILNYKAPLAQNLMGRRPGESVEFNLAGASGTYVVAALENALAGQAGDESA
jgi:transcription elongation factor GreA